MESKIIHGIVKQFFSAPSSTGSSARNHHLRGAATRSRGRRLQARHVVAKDEPLKDEAVELGEVVERPVHVVILQLLQGEVSLAQKYSLTHYPAVFDTDLEVGTLQSSVGSLQETRN